MPDTIQFGTGNQIINRYAASRWLSGGRKLGTEYFTRVTNLAVPLITGQVINQTYSLNVINQNGTAYIDNKEYTTLNGNPALTAINRVHNAEGYTDNLLNPYGPFYYYDRKDHLGNIREVWRAAGFPPAGTVQYTQYYPSGLPWASNSIDNPITQPYKYNGKEFVEMNGYDTYDYGARGYYPAMGRFTSMDPLAEKYYSLSPYAYCADNPINFIDPNGKWIKLSEAVKYNYNSTEVETKKGISNDLRGALEDVLSTPEGCAFFAQFAKKRDRIAGHTFEKDGDLSNKTLDVIDYSFSEETSNVKPSPDAGSTEIDPKKGTVTMRLYTYQLKNKEEIAETVDHETQDHGYKANDKLNGKKVTSEDEDHKALRDKDMTHPGYKGYNSMKNHLEKNNKQYKKTFKEREDYYKEEYKDIK